MEPEQPKFREEALKLLHSSEEYSQIIEVVPETTWIALYAIVAIMVGVLVWSILGSISTTVSSQGILVPHNGYFTEVLADKAAEVLSVLVKEGQEVKKGQTLAILDYSKAIKSAVKSPLDGSIVSIHTAEGKMITLGTPLFQIRSEGEGEGLDALLLIQSKESNIIQPGMKTILKTENLNKDYQLEGVVGAIEPFSETSSEMMTMFPLFQKETLKNLTFHQKIDEAKLIRVNIDANSNQMIDDKINPGTKVDVKIIVKVERPISLIFPSISEILRAY